MTTVLVHVCKEQFNEFKNNRIFYGYSIVCWDNAISLSLNVGEWDIELGRHYSSEGYKMTCSRKPIVKPEKPTSTLILGDRKIDL